MKIELTRIAAVLVVIAAMTLVTGQSAGNRSYELGYHVDEGTTFTVEVKTKHCNFRDFMGQPLTTRSEALAEYDITVESRDDDGARLEIEFAKRDHRLDDTATWSSADFARLIGRKVKVLLSPTGEPFDFRGFDRLPTIAIPGEDDPQGEQRYLNDVLGLFPRLPNASITPEGSWPDSVRYHEPIGDVTLPLQVDYTYRLIGEARFAGHDCVKIEGEFTVHMSGPLVADGLELQLNLQGTGTETVYFAWKKGMFLSSETRAVVEGSADNPDLGVSIPMKHDIETTTTVTLLRKRDAG